MATKRDTQGRPVIGADKRVLTVPAEVRDAIVTWPEWFAVELTEEGLLYRPSDGPVEQPGSRDVPSWARAK